MKFVRIATAAAVVASSVVGLTHASAMTPQVVGQLCGFSSTEAPNGDIVTEVHGGPVVAYDGASMVDPAEVYLFCSLQAGGTGLASEPYDARVDAEGIEGAVLPPTPVAYHASPTGRQFVCSEIWIATSEGHLSIYYDYPSGTWVPEPSDAQCAAVNTGGLQQYVATINPATGGASALGASFDYRGGCGFAALNDTTPGGQLGGNDVWNGTVTLNAIATDTSANRVPTGAAVTASCELKVNGVSQGTLLGPVSGTGLVATVGTIQYTAAITDIVSLCDHVTVGSETVVNCSDATTTPVVPQPIIDAVDLVGATLANTVGVVLDILNQTVFSQSDSVVCAALISVAPTVDSLGHPEIAYIDWSTGDAYYFGNKFWDCPPYDG